MEAPDPEIAELQGKIKELLSAQQDMNINVKVDINIPALGNAGMEAVKLILDTLGKIFK